MEKIKNYKFEYKDTFPKNIFSCQFFKTGDDTVNILGTFTGEKEFYCSIRDEYLKDYSACCTKHDGDKPSGHRHCQSYLEKIGNMGDKERLELRNLKLIKNSLEKTEKSIQQSRHANIIALLLVVITLGSLFLTYHFNKNNLEKTNEQLYLLTESTKQSRASLDILANKEGVNLKPVIKIESILYKNSQLGTPKIVVSNIGKIEAINTVVQIILRKYDGENFVGATFGGNDKQYMYDKIVTYESKEIILPDKFIIDPEYNIIELRVHYMRDYDKQSYSYRTFYLYKQYNDTFGSWRNIEEAKHFKEYENSNIFEALESLPLELYDEKILKITNDKLYEIE